jgi:hypothetical protein
MRTVSTCMQGINRYSSQVELSVKRKGERNKGVKVEGYIIINFYSFFCFVVFPQFPFVNYSR